MKRTIFFTVVAALSFSVAEAAITFVPGVLQEEYWAGKLKGDIAAGTAGTPTFTTNLTEFQIPSDIADNYAVRVSGFFIPAVTANYSFNISADDTADLFLSTDNNPVNKRIIAQQPGWNATRLWVTDSGDGAASTISTPLTDLRQRISRTWLNASGVAQWSNGIPLVAGTRYYIEVQFNEFGGGDNLAVSYRYPATAAEGTATVEWPADADPPNIDSSLIGISYTSPTTFAITNQPQSTTVFAGRTATFTVGVQSDAQVNGTPLATVYQWRKGGVNLLNATAPTLAYVASQSDTGAQFDCVVSLPAASGFTNRATSSAATLTVQAGVLVNGKLKDEFFSGQSRLAVETGVGGNPTFVDAFTSFHAPVNFADGFTRRVSGYFTPATSGNYVFFTCSDDDSDLFLSTDDSPSKKRLIAQEQNWSGDLQWQTSGGNSPQSQRRSDQWSPDGTATPYSAGIPLVAGTRYYIEGVHHEGGGGDDFAATFKLMADPDPADGDATKLTGAVIAYITSPVTTGTITNQPQSLTAYESQTVSLSVGVQTDSELRPLYQWRKGGANIANANAATYSISYAVVADSGSYDCVVTIPNSPNPPLTSSAAAVTVQTAAFAAGYLKYEYFPGFLRTDVEAGTAGNPSSAGNTIGSDKSGAVTSFESGITFADNYANRFSGFFIPPTTGDYVFFVASDDDSDLFLSTDDKPANKRMIAQEVSWSNNRSWITPGNGAAEQKRSDQWVDATGATPWAAGIHLVANTHYYLEGVHHEGGGGDDFGATYSLLGVDPLDGDAPKLTGNVIGVLVPPQPLTITQQPQSVSVAAPNTATFTVAATTTGFYPPTYQWKKGGVDIVGATSANYTTPVTTTNDNGSQYLCAISILGTNPTNSQTATLTVTPDVVPPTLVSARRSFTNDSKLIVVFSEGVTAATANSAANYSINNGAILVSAAVLGADGKTVELTTAPIAKGTVNTLTVNGIRDTSNNLIVANSQIAVTFQRGVLFATATPAPGPLTFAGDIAVSQHLIDRGYYVEITSGTDVPDDGSTAVGKDLIIESSSLGSGTVEIADPAGGPVNVSKFKFLTIPAIEWEASSQDAFGFQGANGITTGNQTDVNIVDASSPLAAGLSAGLHTVVTSPQTFSQSGLATPPVGAHIVATLATDPTQAIIYNYDTGEKGFNDFVMPARRVFFFFQDNTAAAANADGWKLFDAAVDWAQNISVAPRPTFAAPTISAGSLRLQWTGSGTLQQTDSLSPPNWLPASSQANPQTVPVGTTGSKYYRIVAP